MQRVQSSTNGLSCARTATPSNPPLEKGDLGGFDRRDAAVPRARRNRVIAEPYSPVNAPAYDKRGGVHFADQIGSTRLLMTGTGSGGVARTYEYGPYGERQHWNFDIGSGGADTPFRFGGKIHHAPLGLSYFPYRHYSPAQARWTTRDPLGMIDGPNVYAYVGGNPVNRVDPLGMLSVDIGCLLDCLVLDDLDDIAELLKKKKPSRRDILRVAKLAAKRAHPLVTAGQVCYCVTKCTTLW